MRTSINLAAQPYVNLQGIKQRWMMISAIVVGLTLVLGIWTGLVLRKQKNLDTQIKNLENSCDQLDQKIATVQQTLRQPQNVELIDQSQFLNEIILRKSFSWTKVFEEFETIMPPRVQLQQIQPVLQPNHELVMHLSVIGTRDDAIKLLEKIETLPDFTHAILKTETLDPTTHQTTFVISATYVGGEKRLAKETAAAAASKTAEEKPGKKPADKNEENDKNEKSGKNNGGASSQKPSQKQGAGKRI